MISAKKPTKNEKRKKFSTDEEKRPGGSTPHGARTGTGEEGAEIVCKIGREK